MALKKKPRRGVHVVSPPSFDKSRLDRIHIAMQPLLTRNVTEKEMNEILFEADEYIDKRPSWMARFLVSVGLREGKKRQPLDYP